MQVVLPNGWCLHPQFHALHNDMVQRALPGYQGLCPDRLGGIEWLHCIQMEEALPIHYFELNPEHGANLISVAHSFAIHPDAKLIVCNPKKRCKDHRDESFDLYGYENASCPFCSDILLHENLTRLQQSSRIFYSTMQLREVCQYLDTIFLNIAYCNEVGLDCTENGLEDWLYAIWYSVVSKGVLLCNLNDNTKDDIKRFLRKVEHEISNATVHKEQLFLLKK